MSYPFQKLLGILFASYELLNKKQKFENSQSSFLTLSNMFPSTEMM